MPFPHSAVSVPLSMLLLFLLMYHLSSYSSSLLCFYSFSLLPPLQPAFAPSTSLSLFFCPFTLSLSLISLLHYLLSLSHILHFFLSDFASHAFFTSPLSSSTFPLILSSHLPSLPLLLAPSHSFPKHFPTQPQNLP